MADFAHPTGTGIKGTTNTFGGTSTAEYGPLLQSVYPGPGFVPLDFRQSFLQKFTQVWREAS